MESVKSVAAKPRKSVPVDPRTRQEPVGLAPAGLATAPPTPPASPVALLAQLAQLALLALLALAAAPNWAPALVPQRQRPATAVDAATVACHVSPAAVP